VCQLSKTPWYSEAPEREIIDQREILRNQVPGLHKLDRKVVSAKASFSIQSKEEKLRELGVKI
jgi:hypothetical protein